MTKIYSKCCGREVDYTGLISKEDWFDPHGIPVAIPECPICRKNGGYLPFIDDNFHNDIHYKGEIKKTCGYALRNKNVYCMKFGHSKYNHRCKIHFDIENKKNIKLNHDNLIK